MKRTQISDIIAIRMKMQTVQKDLMNNFKVNSDFNKIIGPEFINKYKDWDNMKKHKFLIALGGPMNFEKTQRYFNFLDRKHNNK